MSQQLNERYEIGKEFTVGELRQVYHAIVGQPLRAPNRQAIDRRVDALVRGFPLRWEFEINRLRGYAWDQSELV